MTLVMFSMTQDGVDRMLTFNLWILSSFKYFKYSYNSFRYICT